MEDPVTHSSQEGAHRGLGLLSHKGCSLGVVNYFIMAETTGGESIPILLYAPYINTDTVAGLALTVLLDNGIALDGYCRGADGPWLLFRQQPFEGSRGSARDHPGAQG